MIKLYGVPLSRAFRPLWMLEELDLPYENVPIHFASGETKKPDFLTLNPNGHIPVLEDGDLVLFESMAINLYLARKYDKGDKGLWPRNAKDEGRTYQWSFWAMTELEEPLLTYLMHTALLPKDQRQPAEADDAKERIKKPLGVLEGALAKRDWLVTDGFSAADLNVASVLIWARMGRLDLSAWPKVDAWLGRCTERPAAKKASGRG
jgi:glutathione S-transferase